MDAAVFIVMHLSRTSISDFLMLQLQKFTSLPCEVVTDGAEIETGHIYIAPPDVHLLIKKRNHPPGAWATGKPVASFY